MHLLKENKMLAEAEADASQAIKIFSNQSGDSDRRVARTSVILAQIREKGGNPRGADAAYRDAVRIVQTNPRISPELQASAQMRYGIFLVKTRRPAAAQPLLENALTIEAKLYGAQSKQAADLRQELASCRFALRKGGQ